MHVSAHRECSECPQRVGLPEGAGRRVGDNRSNLLDGRYCAGSTGTTWRARRAGSGALRIPGHPCRPEDYEAYSRVLRCGTYDGSRRNGDGIPRKNASQRRNRSVTPTPLRDVRRDALSAMD
jgi:hypothetical protein